MPDYQHIDLRRDGAVLIATLNNPPRNLMNARMVEEMHAVVDGIADDAEVRALIFTGGADGIFITHYDVGELSTRTLICDARGRCSSRRSTIRRGIS